jgi:endo-1,3(4)-beta-glucanase
MAFESQILTSVPIDEESSSEDSMSAYAIKMWGCTIGDSNMEARGNLQLAVTARSLQNYFLYESNNTVQPASFIENKVSGILVRFLSLSFQK